MNTSYISDISEASMLEAENTIVAIEAQRLIGECYNVCTEIAESSGEGVLSRLALMFKKLCSTVVEFMKKIIKFILKIISAPFKFIHNIVRGGKEGSSTGGGGSGGSTGGGGTKIFSNRDALLKPMDAYDVFYRNAKFESITTNIQNMNEAHVKKVFDDIISKNITKTFSVESSVTYEGLDYLKGYSFSNLFNINSKRNVDILKNMAKEIVSNGINIEFLPTVGGFLDNPSNYSVENIKKLEAGVQNGIMATDLLIKLSTEDYNIIGQKTSNTIELKKMLANPKSIRPEYVTEENMKINVVGNLSAKYICDNYTKILISDDEELFKEMFPGEKIPKIDNYTSLSLNKDICNISKLNLTKATGRYNFKMTKDTFTNKNVSNGTGMKSINNAMERLQSDLDALNTVYKSIDVLFETGDAVLVDRMKDTKETTLKALANFVTISRSYSVSLCDMVGLYAMYNVYNSSLEDLYVATLMLHFIKDHINIEMNKLSPKEKKQYQNGYNAIKNIYSIHSSQATGYLKENNTIKNKSK